MTTRTGIRTLALAALCSAALSGCVVAPARPYGGYAPADDVIVTDVAPPAPYYETVPVVPFAGAIWINGYWGWSGGRHVWSPGHYEHGRPGYAWEPHRWVNQGGRWHLHEGRWVRR